ncbi:MAG: hypothetical protein ACRED5_10955 [Propylenella sp.]
MLYTVAIAICLMTTPVPACQKATALSWIVAPERPASLGGCMRHGMFYAATSNLVKEDSYAKVFCSTGTTAGKSTAQLQ